MDNIAEVFDCLKTYLINKAYTFKSTYLIVPGFFDGCIEDLKKSNNIAELHSVIKTAQKNRIDGFGNYHVLIKLLKYIVDFGFNKPNFYFTEKIIVEFFFVETNNKSISTAVSYKRIILAFANYYNKKINKPMININYQKQQKNKISKFDVLTRDEVRRLIIAIGNQKYKNYIINTLIMEILLYTGIRVSELINIRNSDIRIRGDVCFFRIKGKNNIYRVVVFKMNKDTKEKILYCMRDSSSADFLLRKKSKALTRQYVYSLVRKILNDAHIFKTKMGPHLLRHTFATFYYKKNKDLLMTQEFLGHISINTTTRYLHLCNEDYDKISSYIYK